jgi:acetyl-CoA C-acetyltransferase
VTALDPSTPVLVGWQAVSRRDEDFRDGVEAVAMMAEAARSVVPDDLRPSVLPAIDWIGVTEGLTRYADPGRLVAERIGARGAHTVLAKIGVMQQTLISDACAAVRSGSSRFALVVGGEAHYRHVRAAAAGQAVIVTSQPPGVEPDETLSSEAFDAGMDHPAEGDAGLAGTPGYYALIDSHWRSAHGLGLDEHRDAIAALYARFAEIATHNPHAARPHPYRASDIRDPSTTNPMIAFPYTKLMITTWTVDQGCALLFTTAATADAVGIPRDRWRFPVIAVESNHVVPVAARTRLSQPASLRIIADAVRQRTGIDTAEIELLDLYSAFPAPVLVAAEGLRVPQGRDLTLTGGMAFAGGPLNSYVFHAVARAADRLADPATPVALVSAVSGFYSKQGVLVIGSDPPGQPFESVDVTTDVAAAEPAIPLARSAEGHGTVVAYTVLCTGGEPDRAIAVVDLDDGRRAVARSHDTDVMSSAMTDDLVGRTVAVRGGLFTVDAVTDGRRLVR